MHTLLLFVIHILTSALLATTTPATTQRKHARAALGDISNKVLVKEIKALEQDNASLQEENAYLKKHTELQQNVIISFCAVELARHKRRS